MTKYQVKEFFLDWLPMFAVGGIIVVLLGVVFYIEYDGRVCLRSHREMVHHPGRMVYNAALKMPIFEAAHDVMEEICDEYEGE